VPASPSPLADAIAALPDGDGDAADRKSAG
jgi:hypothetical protein